MDTHDPQLLNAFGREQDPTIINTGVPSERTFLPEEALLAIKTLENAGYEAWAVGGCVRDMLRNVPFDDIDIATSAPWQETERVFLELAAEDDFSPSNPSNYHIAVHETGTQHGTVTVVIGDFAFETTTYRTDGSYSDSRHPDSVRFVNTIQEDLARRDFTINAMAYHPKHGVIDPFNGQADLQQGVIRTVGDPLQRFSEDALRILRGCRFCSQLGFRIDEATMRGMMHAKHLLSSISRDRITTELTKLLCGPHAGRALMETVDVLSAVLPELVAMKGFNQQTPYHVYDVLEHTAHMVDAISPTPVMRWAALLHDVGKPAVFFTDDKGQGHFYGHAPVSGMLATGIMNRLSFGTATRNRIIELVSRHDDELTATARCVCQTLNRMNGNEELFRQYCELKKADASAHAPGFQQRMDIAEQALKILDDLIAKGQAFKLADLAINGNDLIAAGMEPGPHLGHTLQAALDAVIEGQIANERGPLLCFALTFGKEPPLENED